LVSLAVNCGRSDEAVVRRFWYLCRRCVERLEAFSHHQAKGQVLSWASVRSASLGSRRRPGAKDVGGQRGRIPIHRPPHAAGAWGAAGVVR